MLFREPVGPSLVKSSDFVNVKAVFDAANEPPMFSLMVTAFSHHVVPTLNAVVKVSTLLELPI